MEGDKLVVYCQAGCLQADAFAAARAILLPRNGDRRADTKTFGYTDEHWNLLYQVVRKPGKQFVQRRPDGKEWAYNLNGTRRVLYRLPELLATDPSHRVYVVEGEKDVETLRAQGLVATTNSGGAGGWLPDLAQPFSCRPVVILPDNDGPGHELAMKRAHDIEAAGASEVKIVELPGLAEHGDVTDWLGQGHKVEELEALLLAAPAFQPSPSAVGDVRPLGDVLEDVEQFITRFVSFTSRAQADATTLWTAHTHGLDFAQTSPYLAVTSPEKRSGKTRLLEVLELLVKEPWRMATPSEAVLFRHIHDAHPTLLFDEIDAVFGPKAGRDNDGKRAILNAGYRRGTFVPRMVGEGTKQHVENFDVFCPKALAGIGKLPDTVADRSIAIRLHRRKRDEPVERLRYRVVRPQGEALRDELSAVMGQQDLADKLPDLPSELNDRAADGWEPLLAIADAAGGRWPEHARLAAVILSAVSDADEQGLGIKLLDDIRTVLAEIPEDRIPTAKLKDRLRREEEWPWLEKNLTPTMLARLLKKYEIKPKTIKPGGGADSAKGYKREDFEEVFERYLP
jgi:hypothetical protein